MRPLFDLATALFALAAAVFWFWASYGTLPPMLSYFSSIPASDPYQQAVKRSARLNSVAAFLSRMLRVLCLPQLVGWAVRRCSLSGSTLWRPSSRRGADH